MKLIKHNIYTFTRKYDFVEKVIFSSTMNVEDTKKEYAIHTDSSLTKNQDFPDEYLEFKNCIAISGGKIRKATAEEILKLIKAESEFIDSFLVPHHTIIKQLKETIKKKEEKQ